MNYGIKVSKYGYDVNTANSEQLILNSSNNILQIFDRGTATINVPVGETTGSVTIQHNLGYAPGFLAYRYDNGMRRVAYAYSGRCQTTYGCRGGYTNNKTLTIEIMEASPGNYDIYYIIFKAPIDVSSNGVSSLKSDYGISVSEDGKDVMDNDDKNLIYSSKFDTLKQFANGECEVITTSAPSTGYIDIRHNLGYMPAFKVYYKNPFLSNYLETPDMVSFEGVVYFDAWVTKDYLRIFVEKLDDLAGNNFLFKYYIFNNKIEGD